MTSRDTERDTIRAAIDRLIDGRPERSTGALTVLQLAAEADVKRWVLTHKHPDLKAEFEQCRDATSSVPAAYRGLAARVTDLEAANHRLRGENAELRQRVDAYAQTIRRIATQRSQHHPDKSLHAIPNPRTTSR